jgi:hypothetical protein
VSAKDIAHAAIDCEKDLLYAEARVRELKRALTARICPHCGLSLTPDEPVREPPAPRE